MPILGPVQVDPCVPAGEAAHVAVEGKGKKMDQGSSSSKLPAETQTRADLPPKEVLKQKVHH